MPSPVGSRKWQNNSPLPTHCVCLRSVITQRSKTDFGRFVGESRVRERGLGVILCTYIPILRRRYVEGTSLEELLCVVYVILDEISQKSEGTHLMSLEAC